LPRTVILVLILASLPSTLTAQTLPPHDTPAMRLIAGLNFGQVMQAARAEEVARTKTYLRQRLEEELGSPTAEEYAEVDAMIDELLAKYTIDDTIADFAPLFEAHFTTAELEELAKFFNSPVFRRFQAETPHINAEALEGVKTKMRPAIQATVNRLSARISEIKKGRSRK